MKPLCSFFVLAVLLAPHLTFGQTKLLIARSNVYVDDATGAPTSGDSTTLEYNNQHQTTQFKSWKIDGNGAWKLSYRIIDRTFDAEGRVLTETGQEGNDVDGWANDGRNTYTYDSHGNRVTWLSEEWDGTMWVTDFVSNTAWTYNANGQVLSRAGSSYRSFFTYNAQDSLATTTNQNLIGNNWVNADSIVYAYSPDGTILLSETTYAWGTGNWSESYRSLYTYEADGDLAQELIEYWLGTDWGNGALFEYTYDANHNLTYWIWKNWTTDTWDPSFRQYNTYEAPNYWLGAIFEGWDGSDWGLISIAHNYYTEFVPTHEPMVADFLIYPNPANTALTLQGEGLVLAQVLDQQGRVVLSKVLSGQVQAALEMGQLPSGTYFLQVIGKDGSIGGKPLQVRH